MKELIEASLIVLVTGVAIGLLIFGTTRLISWQDAEELKEAKIACAEIAKIGQVKHWKLSEDNTSCFLVVNGELKEVKDW